MDIKGQVAVVTGGASGLGAATAKMLAEAGARVTIFDKNHSLACQVADTIGGLAVEVDVSSGNSVAQGYLVAREAYGQESILVNCAGIGIPERTVNRNGTPHSSENFIRTIQINLIGTFHCCSQAAAGMSGGDPVSEDGERGVIINTASVAAFDGQIGQVAYSASKGGVVGMTLPMARDLAKQGIRVLAIAPGLFLTPMIDSLSEEAQRSIAAQIPFPSRLGKPKEYAKLVSQLIENPMLNGEVIRLDGAARLAPR